MEHACAVSEGLQSDWLESRSYDRYKLHFATYRRGFSPETEEWVMHGLIKAMPTLKIADYFKVKREIWFAECEYLIVAVDNETGELVGLLASHWHEDEGRPLFLQISIQMITDRYRRTHLLKHMWAFHFEKVVEGVFGFPSVIALRTYNPVVYASMRIFSRIEGVNLYPRLHVSEQDPGMVRIAEQIAALLCPALEFIPQTGVIRGASVPPDFYPCLPESNKADIKSYFEKNLTPADRLLCVLSVPTEQAKQRIMKAFGAEASREMPLQQVG